MCFQPIYRSNVTLTDQNGDENEQIIKMNLKDTILENIYWSCKEINYILSMSSFSKLSCDVILLKRKLSIERNKRLSESHDFMILRGVTMYRAKKTVVLICAKNCLDLVAILETLYIPFYTDIFGLLLFII